MLLRMQGETVTRSNFTYAYRAYSIRAALAAFKENNRVNYRNIWN